MANNMGIKLGVEGEKDFKNALADINRNFRVLGSEMKLVSSQFDKNDTSVEALSSRNKEMDIDTVAHRVSSVIVNDIMIKGGAYA